MVREMVSVYWEGTETSNSWVWLGDRMVEMEVPVVMVSDWQWTCE